MKIFWLPCVLFIASYVGLSRSDDSIISSDYIDFEKTKESAKTLLKFNNIKDKFKLSKEEVTAFTKSFDVESIELLWPG